ncbi:MAG: tRNA pseudouridine(38-40) synthase TruA [Desulfitobacteriaceae bacterium]|nr:tRNA pseudouridine(38-40) synthase TruA [Desulfitobacteriaceae bacterium]
MKRNIKLLIEYDGTNYIGWQRQPEHQGMSIQGVLEKCLGKITGQNVLIQGAGRTDSGVHARGQVANFFTESRIPVQRIPYALAGMLPNDIVVRGAWDVPEHFHARYSALEKTYCYTILLPDCRSAFEWRYAYYSPFHLDVEKMNQAVSFLEGTHDYSSFCAKGSPVKNFIRTVRWCRIRQDDHHLYVDVTANGFLYNMVRIIVGTLIEIGRGKWEPIKIVEILEARDRKKAGPTIGPQGLTLLNIKYDKTDSMS